MTLSNFDWTDKTSIKWFIMLPTGHEGPYSFEAIKQRTKQGKISPEVNVWAEGLTRAIAFRDLVRQVDGEIEIQNIDEDLPPPLPPTPEEEIPALPLEPEDTPQVSLPKKRYTWVLIPLTLMIVGFFGYQWFKDQEKITLNRPERLPLEQFRKIGAALEFQGWDKTIFFKEFVSRDLSRIWLATNSFQTCDVSATFTSENDKLLVLEDPTPVSFKTSGTLKNHLVEFSQFEFLAGNKIIPGLYKMDVHAKNCAWDSLRAKVGNLFRAPETEYKANVNVILFADGAEEFHRVLDSLLKKKAQVALEVEGQKDLFWLDLQQKYQTLLAISLQIEQFFLDFLEGPLGDFQGKLKPMVDGYTRKYGSLLTNFVVSNETYFKELSRSDLQGIALSKNYEEGIRMTSKEVGGTAMKFIERLQKIKSAPKPAEAEALKNELTGSFSGIKGIINQRLIEVTEDRSKSP